MCAGIAALIILHFMTWNVPSYVDAEMTVGEPRPTAHAQYTQYRLQAAQAGESFRIQTRIPHMYWSPSVSCTGGFNTAKGICILSFGWWWAKYHKICRIYGPLL